MGNKNEQGPFAAWVEDYTSDQQQIILRVEHEDGHMPHPEHISVRECGLLRISQSVDVIEVQEHDGTFRPHLMRAS